MNQITKRKVLLAFYDNYVTIYSSEMKQTHLHSIKSEYYINAFHERWQTKNHKITWGDHATHYENSPKVDTPSVYDTLLQIYWDG